MPEVELYLKTLEGTIMKMLLGSLWNSRSIETEQVIPPKSLPRGDVPRVVPFAASAHMTPVAGYAKPHKIHRLVFGTFAAATLDREPHCALEGFRHKTWKEPDEKCSAVNW